MGKEALHLGHNDLGITGVEENTLVAGLCDLLERVWAHGLKKKQVKILIFCINFYFRENLHYGLISLHIMIVKNLNY